MIKCSFQKSGNIGILDFQGSLTATNTDELKLALIRSIHNTDNLFFNFSHVTEIDNSCLTLLCSARRISLKMNKRITLLGICAKGLDSIIRDTGYTCRNLCAERTRPQCFLKLHGNAA